MVQDTLTQPEKKILYQESLDSKILDILSIARGKTIDQRRLDELRKYVGQLNKLAEKDGKGEVNTSRYRELSKKSLEFYESLVKFFEVKK